MVTRRSSNYDNDSDSAVSSSSASSHGSTSFLTRPDPAVPVRKGMRLKKKGHRVDFFLTLAFGFMATWLCMMVFIKSIPTHYHWLVYYVFTGPSSPP